VNVHHLADQVVSFCQTSEPGLEVFHETDHIRGTGGALDFARGTLARYETFCVCNVDIVATVNLHALNLTFDKADWAVGLVAAPAAGKGTIFYDADSGEYRGAASQEAGEWEGASRADFLGITFYRKEFLDMVLADDFSVVPLWKRAQKKGLKVKVLVAGGAYWRDIGTPQAYARIHFDILDAALGIGISPKLHIDREAKRAYPRDIAPRSLAAMGPYAWTNSTEIASTASLKRSIVLHGSRVTGNARISQMVVTPWGDMSCA
jgi:NDP-sugar pyrophosphorylase family protein